MVPKLIREFKWVEEKERSVALLKMVRRSPNPFPPSSNPHHPLSYSVHLRVDCWSLQGLLEWEDLSGELASAASKGGPCMDGSPIWNEVSDAVTSALSPQEFLTILSASTRCRAAGESPGVTAFSQVGSEGRDCVRTLNRMQAELVSITVPSSSTCSSPSDFVSSLRVWTTHLVGVSDPNVCEPCGVERPVRQPPSQPILSSSPLPEPASWGGIVRECTVP